jgi:acyl-coenzyme A thioesterase PaaI-like protein
VATPIHVGRTTIVVQTEVTRDDGKPVSLTIQTQTVLPGS